MLVTALLWPVAIAVSTVVLTVMATSGARLQNDGHYYVHTEGVGWSQASLGEFVVGSLACGGIASTLLFAGVMAILSIVWFATKDS